MLHILPMRVLFNSAGYNNEGIWNWTGHDGDWIYQGGPNSSAVKNNVTFNQWGPEGDALDDSPVSYHITEPVDPLVVDSWLSNVGGGLY